MLSNIKHYWKTITTFCGVAAMLLNEATNTFGTALPEPWKHYVSGAIALLTIIATYQVPYLPKTAPGPVGRRPVV